MGNDFGGGGGGAVSNHGYNTKNNSMIQVSPVLTYERTIPQLQNSSIFHMNCFLCIIILNSVIGTLYSTKY